MREQSLKVNIFSECNNGVASTTSPCKDSSATRTSFSEPVSDDSG